MLYAPGVDSAFSGVTESCLCVLLRIHFCELHGIRPHAGEPGDEMRFCHLVAHRNKNLAAFILHIDFVVFNLPKFIFNFKSRKLNSAAPVTYWFIFTSKK